MIQTKFFFMQDISCIQVVLDSPNQKWSFSLIKWALQDRQLAKNIFFLAKNIV
jgi:hypothetical protein